MLFNLIKYYYHLIIVLPFLYFIIGNFNDLNYSQVLVVFYIPFGLSIVFTILFFRSNHRDSLLSFFSLLVFILFTSSITAVNITEFWYSIFSIFISIVLTLLLNKYGDLKKILAIVAATMVTVCIAQIGLLAIPQIPSPLNDNVIKHSDQPVQITPNIYSITLDAYSRYDQLKKIGHENKYFEDTIKNSGFFVADRATSNFMTTQLSMYTFWEMDFPVSVDKEKPYIVKSSSEITQVLRGNNTVINSLRSLGYQHIRMGPNQSKPQDCSGFEDICLYMINPTDGSAYGAGGNIYINIVEMTPFLDRFQIAFPTLFSRNTYLESTIDDGLREWKRIKNDVGEPYFVEMNVWQPHPPYLLNEKCEKQQDIIPYGALSWKSSSIDHYSQELYCANSHLTNLVTYISKHDPNAIVLIQSDHGHSFNVDWKVNADRWTEDSILVRSAILWAGKFPKICQKYLYKNISTINTFRVVFSCLYGEHLELLPDKIYINNMGLVEYTGQR